MKDKEVIANYEFLKESFLLMADYYGMHRTLSRAIVEGHSSVAEACYPKKVNARTFRDYQRFIRMCSHLSLVFSRIKKHCENEVEK